MDANRFDSVSKFFAQRRLSRREAMIKGGTALAAGGIAATGLARMASAQDATPATAEDVASGEISFLFVQSFQGGSIAPKEGVEGRYTLTLESGVGQTIFFSDRPNREVGAGPTAEVLDFLGFPDDNPPNAALVFEKAPGDTDIAVVELFSPVYDEATGGLTYEVEVLQNWEAELDMALGEAPTDLSAVAASFGTAHLFIDSATQGALDCPDANFSCYTHDTNGAIRIHGEISNAEHGGYCGVLQCTPCKETPDGGGSWRDVCNARFSECNGQCDYGPWCVRGIYSYCDGKLH